MKDSSISMAHLRLRMNIDIFVGTTMIGYEDDKKQYQIQGDKLIHGRIRGNISYDRIDHRTECKP